MAKAILASCEDSGPSATDSLYTALEEDAHREKGLGGPLSSSSASGSFSCNRLTPQRRSLHHQLTTLCWAQGPFAIWPLKTTWESINISVLLFDLEKLVELLCSSQVNGLKSSNSFNTFDTLKRARSAAEKRTLMLKRNRTSGSLSPVDGRVRVASEEQNFGEKQVAGTLDPSGGIKRHKKAKSSKKVKRPSSGKTGVAVATDAAKLLLSCFFPWGVNRELDSLCVRYLGILRLFSPVSFGQFSKDNYLALMLPGWSSANLGRVEKQQEVVNLFSSKVLPLYSKYYSVTQEQAGKKNGYRNTVAFTEQRLTLAYLLSRMSLVQRIINMPSEEASPVKLESVRNKWRPAASLGLPDFNPESSQHTLRFPAGESDDRSFVKLLSCWKDQSIEVMEATQAALLAEVQQSVQQKTLAEGCGQTNSSGQGSANGQPEGAKNPCLVGTMGMVKCESCITSPTVEDREGFAEQWVLEEPGSPDVKKPHPWVSKVCSCKVC